MSANLLSTVTADLIASCGNTAKNVIDAYRAGGERVVTVLEQRWNRALKASRSQLTAEVARNASAAQLAFSVLYSKGLTQTSHGAQQVVIQMVNLLDAGVQRAAANAALFEEKTGIATLSTIASAAAPGALALGKVATHLEQKSAELAGKMAGNDVLNANVRRRSAFRQQRAAQTA